MNSCFCCRLYNVSIPSVTSEYAFSGSLCRICEFETIDGSRYCVTIFSLSDYKHLHFPHDEYKMLIRKLCALLSTQAIAAHDNSTGQKSDDSRLTIEQLPFNGDFKIRFGILTMTIGSVTAFGLLKTTPFIFENDNNNNNVSANEKHFMCDPKWDICTCKSCPVFSRLIDFEAAAREHFPNYETKNIIFWIKNQKSVISNTSCSENGIAAKTLVRKSICKKTE